MRDWREDKVVMLLKIDGVESAIEAGRK